MSLVPLAADELPSALALLIASATSSSFKPLYHYRNASFCDNGASKNLTLVSATHLTAFSTCGSRNGRVTKSLAPRPLHRRVHQLTSQVHRLSTPYHEF